MVLRRPASCGAGCGEGQHAGGERQGERPALGAATEQRALPPGTSQPSHRPQVVLVQLPRLGLREEVLRLGAASPVDVLLHAAAGGPHVRHNEQGTYAAPAGAVDDVIQPITEDLAGAVGR